MARKEMTEFGRHVWTLMATRGITTQRELSRLVFERAHATVGFHAVRNYLFGRSMVPSSFPGQVAQALDLDERERSELAMAYAFGQDAETLEDELTAS